MGEGEPLGAPGYLDWLIPGERSTLPLWKRNGIMMRQMTPRCWLVLLGLMLLAGGLVLPAPTVSAANTLHVQSCADDGGGTTLRGQIAVASAGDTIVFDQNCTITLTTGTLTLTKNVTIDGTGHTI